MNDVREVTGTAFVVAEFRARENEEVAHEGMPVDILAQRWSAGGAFRFTEPFEELVGYGWISWACDWFGSGPSSATW